MTGTSPWIHVLLAALGCQIFKVALYGAAHRQFPLRLLVTTNGLPSLHAVTFACLSTVVGLADGFGRPLFAATAVFAGIVLHDVVRVQGTAARSGETARSLAITLEDRAGGPRWLARVRHLLVDRGHRPLHVAVGAVLGVLWGLVWNPS